MQDLHRQPLSCTVYGVFVDVPIEPFSHGISEDDHGVNIKGSESLVTVFPCSP